MADMMTINPIAFAQSLIRCPSVTPEDAGALDLLTTTLTGLGFTCNRLSFGDAPNGPVDNLYARIGTGQPHFCFAGHTDVVPAGDLAQWSVDPFAATISDGMLVGRGANDMKGAIAAFVCAAAAKINQGFKGSLSLLITGDEEGPAEFGTVKVLEWMQAQGELPDHCVVGEPTSARRLGDMIKIGRRGSMNVHITVLGAQGHVAYPDRGDNPITRLVRLLNELKQKTLDTGNAHFQASNLEVTDIAVGNHIDNMLPATARARLNIRFNTEHTGSELSAWIKQVVSDHAPRHELDIRISGEAFLTQPCSLSDMIIEAIKTETGMMPELSTTGGTSDARFIKAVCPVVECGLVGLSMHKVDEQVPIADIEALSRVYKAILDRYFV